MVSSQALEDYTGTEILEQNVSVRQKMRWSPNQAVKDLPEVVQKSFREEAGYLLAELKENKLEVYLVPAPELRHQGHKVRRVANRNPDWYRELYHSHPHLRRDRSLKSLKRISQGEDQPFGQSSHKYAPFKYCFLYRTLIQERLAEVDEGMPTDQRMGHIFKNIEAMVEEEAGGEVPF